MSIVTMVLSGDRTQQSESAAIAHPAPLRIGFWGTHGCFSHAVLAALLKHYPITQVVLPGSPPGAAIALRQPPLGAPVADELLIVNHSLAPETVQLAWQQQIPTYAVQRLRSSAVAQWLAEQALDIVCVACFPSRIPPALLALPTYGFLNLHPSLLPAYRGPAPLFWQLRDGLQAIGVTAHWMDADFDTGALAAQCTLRLPDGASSAELDRLCAATGADLLLQVLHQLEQGRLVRQIQPAAGSQQGWPAAADFRLSPQWPARHAYNFMRGTDEWQQPYLIHVGGEELLLRHALAYTPDQMLDRPLVYRGRTVALQLTPGVLHALLW